MGKNLKMLKCFFKVLGNNKEETTKIIPSMYVKNIHQIDYDKLIHSNIKNLIFDIDNTIVPVDDKNVPQSIVKLFEKLNTNFDICLMSNNVEERVLPVARTLQVKYLSNAQKPKKEAFNQALKILNATKENTAMIGDQMMSDIKGANEYGIYSILTDPLSNKHNIQTKTSRILQNILEKHLTKNNIFTPQKYYIKEMKK